MYSASLPIIVTSIRLEMHEKYDLYMIVSRAKNNFEGHHWPSPWLKSMKIALNDTFHLLY